MNNSLESYHSGLCRSIQVSHPNLFNFLTYCPQTCTALDFLYTLINNMLTATVRTDDDGFLQDTKHMAK